MFDLPWYIAAVAVMACLATLWVYHKTPGVTFPVSALLLFIAITFVAIGQLLVSTLSDVNKEAAQFVASYNRAVIAATALYAFLMVIERYRSRRRLLRG